MKSLKNKVFLSSLLALGMFAFQVTSSMAATVNVSITNNTFTPQTVSINPGDTVTWTNNGTHAHTVTADNGNFNSGLLQPGQSYSYTFSSSGTVRYYCIPHGGPNGSGMSGIVSVGQAVPPQTGCLTLSNNLHMASRDYFTNGEVTKLQQFLYSRGYLSVSPTGYFGRMTMAAVRSFQSSQGIIATGFVGPLTRAAITRVSCGTTPPLPTPISISSLSPSSGPVGTTVTIYGSGFFGDNKIFFDGSSITAQNSPNGTSLTFTVPSYVSPYCPQGAYCALYAKQILPGTYNVQVKNNNGESNIVTFTVTSAPQQNVPTISSLSPSSGNIGTTVTIYGSGFFGTNTVYFGGSAVSAVAASNGQMISFTVPEYISPCNPGMYCILLARQVTPGNYDVRVQNNYGTSNTMQFTVTGQTSGAPVRITGLDAPSRLTVGQSGSFTVRTDNTGGNLSYSVRWGDEGMYAAQSTSAQANFQSSATFTHSYSTPGTYYPVFTVTSGGVTASVSASVVVSY
ncbi:MAG: IPT/TIG domain-containing protein [Candidatus Paceibacterota bacterium]|jgi:plastocyanin